jgi:hypothetical protein
MPSFSNISDNTNPDAPISPEIPDKSGIPINKLLSTSELGLRSRDCGKPAKLYNTCLF